MNSLIPTLALLTVSAGLLHRSSKKRSKKNESRFEPKAKSPWNTLNEGEDPTL